jgi:hypothetical protein
METLAFGVPNILASSEAKTLHKSLSALWELTYGSKPAALSNDVQLCRRFFDPLARGQTLRERLSSLITTPPALLRTLKEFGPPLIYDAGAGTLLLGLEGRLLIDALDRRLGDRSVVVISDPEIAQMEHVALQMYRQWATARLTQVIDLRDGRGREVMQAVAVGVALALLVNRSDTPDRAVLSQGRETLDGKDVNRAVFAGAEEFATIISGGRRGRSADEQKLKGGYGLSEARRRLAHRLTMVRREAQGHQAFYIPNQFRSEVIAFLGRDLARRPTLSGPNLEMAFDSLVSAFRAKAESLAHRSMVFERAGDTLDLRDELLEAFEMARGKSDGETDELTPFVGG